MINYVQNERAAKALLEEVGSDTSITAQADVSDETQAESLVDTTRERFGRLDIVVNNAGVIDRTPTWDTSADTWQSTLAVNTLGPWWLVKHAAEMLTAARGAVVNVSSIYGITGSPAALAYSASKAALGAVTTALAVELAPHVRVNAVAPGNTLTDLTETASDGTVSAFDEITPLRRSARASEIAEVITFLAAPAASYVTGQVIAVDGGYGIRAGV